MIILLEIIIIDFFGFKNKIKLVSYPTEIDTKMVLIHGFMKK